MIYLTKASKQELRNYRAGVGRYFISAGDGRTIISADIILFKNEKGCHITLGNQTITLTKEQAKKLEVYMQTEEEEE